MRKEKRHYENPWRCLLLAVIRVAVGDLDRKDNEYHLVDQLAARRWLTEVGPDVLGYLDLGKYNDHLLELTDNIPNTFGKDGVKCMS